MLENLCTLPLNADVFTTALHPSKPLLTIGLANGRVETFRLPAVSSSENDGDDDDDDDDDDATKANKAKPPVNGRRSLAEIGRGTIDSIWQTRRHKGSCRTLAYSYDGAAMYSAGTDGLVKHFSPEDGRVISKMAIPSRSGEPDGPSMLHALNPQALLLGCDSGALHLIDLRDGAPGQKPAQTHFPHDDYISAVVAMPPTAESTSGVPKQWITTGGTTLAATDWRKGVMKRSEDQEDELLCATFVPGMGPKKNRNNGMVAVGTATGVVTLWDRGVWDDQQERIVVDQARGGGESIDALALVPQELGWGKKLVVAAGDGTLRVVDLVRRKQDSEPGSILRHDDAEAAVSVAFDCHNRLISAGGKTIKVWQELSELQGGGSSEDEDDDEEEDDDDSDDEGAGGSGKRAADSDDEDDDDSDDSDGPRKKRGKRRKTPKKPSEFSFPGL
ncbi:WD repeat-containing protein [Sodiomyces alkalinus F11]|uniref:WD repeat-containing protein JIP5 n=1 Tax=Sodiomyces alkalinus (strain CBS 110278 / VKM F-3762 / F11) TaxID=1314773 RepID=A0A3N2PQB4_SODAK|nr:WD repeat-containing protein [Sodiomyces alkalinus F11]ROT36556.1 WD repeat-containing protein [Sodiomyces alkalinus F11]